MRTMKDSGLEWIGDIPREWETRQIKYALENHSGGAWGANKGESERDCICVRVADFDYSHLSVNYSEVMTVRSYQQKTICDSALKSGDILLEKSGGGEITPVGRSVLFSSEREMMCANFIEWLRPNFSIQPQFLNYWLSAAYSNGYSKRNVKQTTGIQNLDIPAFLSEKVLVPSGEEQQRISHYLDTKCAEIDALIAAKEKTNTLLKEQRQSIIYEAVTKGLDPTVPMKDSGVEWICEIPEGWEIAALKRLGTPATGSTPSKDNPDYWDGNIPWVSSKDMKSDYLLDSEDHITQAAVNECGLTLFNPGTLIFCVRSGILRHTFPVAVATLPVTINQDLRALSLTGDVNPAFLLYYMRGMNDTIVTLYEKIGATVESIEMDWFLYFPVVLPSREEQDRIVKALGSRCTDLDQAVKQNEDTIRQLKEYRQSLIYEAVTGKIEV